MRGRVAQNREGHLPAPASEASVRRLLQNLLPAFAGEGGHAPAVNQQPAGDALVADLGVFGPIQSVRFLGPVDHGIDRDKSEPSDQGSQCRLEKTHWEVYEVKQNRGSSVWLVAATANGSIECIEVAVR